MSSAGNQLVDKNVIAARTDRHFAFSGVGLAFFIERHHNHRCAIAARKFRVMNELCFAFLQTDGVDDGLALHAFQPRLDYRPLAGIDHDRHLADIRFGGDQVQERYHGLLRIQHGFIHVDVDDLCAIFHLVTGNAQCFRIVVIQYQTGECFRAGNISPLAHIHKQGVVAYAQAVPGLTAAVSLESQERRVARHRSLHQR